MEIVQSDTESMLIISYNEEASSYMRVPSAYQEVEYIQSTGTQWIDTGYSPTVNTVIETDLNWQSQTETWWVFFWVTGNDRSSDWILARIYNGISTTLNLWFCNTTYSDCQISTTINARHKLLLQKNWWTFDWTSFTIATNSTPYSSPIVLFWWNNGWSKGWRCWKVMIKSFKITESWVEKRDFIPCYRKSDWVIWMWDRVNKVFYTNSWSGTFTKGSDV